MRILIAPDKCEADMGEFIHIWTSRLPLVLYMIQFSVPFATCSES